MQPMVPETTFYANQQNTMRVPILIQSKPVRIHIMKQNRGRGANDII